MKWSELDLEAGRWTIPARRAKNKLAHRVPFLPGALEILGDVQPRAREERLVFRGGRIGLPLTNLQKPMRRIKETSGVDFRIHDLRRTAAGHMTGIGIPRLVVSKILNHVESGITADYDRHSYEAEKRAALLKWDRHVTAMLAGKRVSNVIPLQR